MAKLNRKVKEMKSKKGFENVWTGIIIGLFVVAIVLGIQQGWFKGIKKEADTLIASVGDDDEDTIQNFFDKCGIADCNPARDQWANKPIETEDETRLGCTEDQEPQPDQWSKEICRRREPSAIVVS